MEKPYTGRAIINESYNGVEITIPAQKNWFVIIFISFWLCMWLLFEILMPTLFLNDGGPGPGIVFGIVWLGGWTVGGVFAASTWWWNVSGKEVVTVTSGVLTIKRKGSLAKTRSYDLAEAKNFRSVEEPTFDFGFGFGRRAFVNPWKPAKNGTVKFDYGLGTVTFGDWLSQAEGNLIIETLRGKRLIS